MATDQAKLVQILDLHLRNDFLQPADILRRYVVLPLNENEVEAVERRRQKHMQTALQELLDNRSMDELAGDEVVRFLRAREKGTLVWNRWESKK